MRDIAVFSGSAHPELAAEICSHLETPLHPVRVNRFANDCLEVQLQANCRERDVFLIQPLVAAGAGEPRRAAPHAGRGQGRLGRPDHRGDAALRLRPLGQEGRAAHLDRRAAGRRPAGDRRSQPGAGDDPALAAGARLLQRPGRPPARPARAGRPLPRVRPVQHRRRLARPGQRQGGGGLRPACSASPVAAGAKQRFSDDRVVISSIIGDVAGRDVIVLDDEIAKGSTVIELLRPAARARASARSGSPAPTACSPTARSSASADQPDVDGDRLHQHRADPDGQARHRSSRCCRSPRRSPRRCAASTTASRSAPCSTPPTPPAGRLRASGG